MTECNGNSTHTLTLNLKSWFKTLNLWLFWLYILLTKKEEDRTSCLKQGWWELTGAKTAGSQ